ncbi:MAG: histidinol-phosphate transaminase [Gammaproteobacteria bacterium]|nr:histidinol-phosphate transaminase [Gammaproteobacteria bacterium]
MNAEKIDNLVKKWVRPDICGLSSYKVQEATGLIKLDAMENPYIWPETLRDDWFTRLRNLDVNRYPHPQAPGVKLALRRVMGIPEDAQLVLGNGSDELIQMIAITLGGPGRTILSVEPSFVMYQMIATFLGLNYVGVPLCPKTFDLDPGRLLAAIEEHQPAVIFLAYPNNPTGNLFDEAVMLQIIEAAPGVVVVDEAYAPFTDASFMSRLLQNEKLLVMRTLSKMGLAGLRLGLLAGPAGWMAEVEKTRLPYNINVMTQMSVEFALNHHEVFEEQTSAIRASRERLLEALAARDGIEPFPSDANFILLRLSKGNAEQVHEGLRSKGVLVKSMHGSHPLLADCLRVTVGNPGENDAFLSALDSVL